ncbi:coiled-coil domain-containing protein 9 isoform X2 [Anas platyrhynchos]|uniref:coiled-coil domain-containing protein 9 isoform X2 n=1 Tax=Anas platyrhynchos TaxID=8839 RepID=UPI003AF2A99B
MAAALDLRSKEEKDAELDKRIEALRKKNEALIRRYQEIEEDRRRAEQEGVAVTAPRHRRPPEPERRKEGGLGEKPGRTERKPPAAPRPPHGAAPRPSGRPPRGEPPPAPRERGARGRRSGGRGGGGAALGGSGGDAGPDRKSQEWEERRRQNIERMNEEMEKIAEYERNQRDGLQDRNPVRSFLDDPRRRGPAQDERHGGSRRHGRNWGGTDFEGVRAGLEQRGRRRAAPTMTGRERAEYARWKQERDEIDRQRLARHRQPTGQWRREWDADKTDGMFNDAPDAEHEPQKRPPKPPTFGEFLPAPRRKRQSRGRNPGTKPYSMHDDRWEEEKEPAAQPGGTDGKGAQELEAAPSGTPLQPPPDPEEDEDEDEWEDVSEEEEEDDEEEEDEEEDDEGPRPVRDWGEEMDLAPPPHGGLRGAPPATPPPAEPAGLSPTEQLDPPGGLPAPPQDTPQHPTQETLQQDPEGPPPGTVEITDFQRPRRPRHRFLFAAGIKARCPAAPVLRPRRRESGRSPRGPGRRKEKGSPRKWGNCGFLGDGEGGGDGEREEALVQRRLLGGPLAPWKSGSVGADGESLKPHLDHRSLLRVENHLSQTPGTPFDIGGPPRGVPAPCSWCTMDFQGYNYSNYSGVEDYIFDDFGDYEVPAGHRAILALYTIIFLLGVLGNGAVIWRLAPDGHQRRPLRPGDAPGVVPKPPDPGGGPGGLCGRVAAGLPPHPPLHHLPRFTTGRHLREGDVRFGILHGWAAPAPHRAPHLRVPVHLRLPRALRGHLRVLRAAAGPRPQQALRPLQEGHQARPGGHRQLLRLLVALPRGGAHPGLQLAHQLLVQERGGGGPGGHRGGLHQQLHQPRHLRGDGPGLQGQVPALLARRAARRDERGPLREHLGRQPRQDQGHRRRPQRQHQRLTSCLRPPPSPPLFFLGRVWMGPEFTRGCVRCPLSFFLPEWGNWRVKLTDVLASWTSLEALWRPPRSSLLGLPPPPPPSLDPVPHSQPHKNHLKPSPPHIPVGQRALR